MSGTKKTSEKAASVGAPVESKIATLKKWITGQLTSIKKGILSVEQVKDIALEIVKQQAPIPNDTPKVYRVNVRWELPNFGGIPMPPNTCFYGFATFDHTEVEVEEGINIEEVLEIAIAEHGALEAGLTVESFSPYI